MSDEAQDARWQQILEAREELADEPEGGPIPLREVGSDRPARRTSRKGAQFDEALSGLGSWSSISEPRRRLSA